MHILDIFERDSTTFSFEFFPPRSAEAWDALFSRHLLLGIGQIGDPVGGPVDPPAVPELGAAAPRAAVPPAAEADCRRVGLGAEAHGHQLLLERDADLGGGRSLGALTLLDRICVGRCSLRIDSRRGGNGRLRLARLPGDLEIEGADLGDRQAVRATVIVGTRREDEPLAAHPDLLEARVALGELPGGDDEARDAALAQAPEVVLHSEQAGRHGRERRQCIARRQTALDRLPETLPEPSIATRGDREGDARRRDCRGVRRGELPVLQVTEGDRVGDEGVIDLLRLRERNGQHERCPGLTDGIEALVLVAGTAEDVLDTDLVSETIGAQERQPVGDGEELRQRPVAQPRLERQVHEIGRAVRRVPLGVEVGLAEDRHEAHQRDREGLARAALVEREVSGGLAGDDQVVVGSRTGRDERAATARQPVGAVREHGDETEGSVVACRGLVGREVRRGVELAPNRLVGVVRTRRFGADDLRRAEAERRPTGRLGETVIPSRDR